MIKATEAQMRAACYAYMHALYEELYCDSQPVPIDDDALNIYLVDHLSHVQPLMHAVLHAALNTKE